MIIYYFDAFMRRQFVNVSNPNQLIENDVPDIHTGGKQYYICFREGDNEIRLAGFRNKSDRDCELEHNRGLYSSTVGIAGDLLPWPPNKRPED